MPSGKESYFEVSNPRIIKDLCDKVLTGELFGFLQVDIHVPNIKTNHESFNLLLD